MANEGVNITPGSGATKVAADSQDLGGGAQSIQMIGGLYYAGADKGWAKGGGGGGNFGGILLARGVRNGPVSLPIAPNPGGRGLILQFFFATASIAGTLYLKANGVQGGEDVRIVDISVPGALTGSHNVIVYPDAATGLLVSDGHSQTLRGIIGREFTGSFNPSAGNVDYALSYATLL